MSRPKNVDAADPGKARHRRTSESVTGEATTASYPDSLPFVLAILAGDRRTEWGRYPSREAAEAIARRLRVHGFHAVTTDTREASR